MDDGWHLLRYSFYGYRSGGSVCRQFAEKCCSEEGKSEGRGKINFLIHFDRKTCILFLNYLKASRPQLVRLTKYTDYWLRSYFHSREAGKYHHLLKSLAAQACTLETREQFSTARLNVDSALWIRYELNAPLELI